MATKKQLKQQLEEAQKRLAHIEQLLATEDVGNPRTHTIAIELDLVFYVDRTTTPIGEIIEQVKDFSNWDFGLETVYRRHQPSFGEHLYVRNISVKELE